MIAIINYGAGNLRSVQKSFQRYYPNTVISNDLETLCQSFAIVVPGVGSFGKAIEELEQLELLNPLKEILSTKMVLGICLGMQLFFDKSEESPESTGLSLIKGEVRKFLEVDEIKIPHIGWNKVITNFVSNNINNFSNIYAYFNHSYYCQPLNTEVICANSLHGVFFPSIIRKSNIFATQFHPEKSGSLGEQVIQWFICEVNKKRCYNDNSCY